jgi:hypothetical protein
MKEEKPETQLASEADSATTSAEPLNTETIVKAIQLIALLQRQEERAKNGTP